MEQRIIFSEHLKSDLATVLSECEHESIYVLTDDHTYADCWPVISKYFSLRHAHMITIPAGDDHKDLDALAQVWEELSKSGATRHACLINLGGGMVTDLGGFAASTFKRGIDFVNIPTTLLAMVDASVGGKTGINFNGLKNEVGVFNRANAVIISPLWLSTLDDGNLRSGYAEMIKHALLADRVKWAEIINFPLEKPNLNMLGEMVKKNVEVKERVVEQDPRETGVRKALNLGHTVGHALEAFSLYKEGHEPLLHGYAVAYGLIAELYLSATKVGFPTDVLHQTVGFIREFYGTPAITCDDYPELISLMKHDKKNSGKHINFTFLSDIGEIKINQTAKEEEIKQALDFLREG